MGKQKTKKDLALSLEIALSTIDVLNNDVTDRDAELNSANMLVGNLHKQLKEAKDQVRDLESESLMDEKINGILADAMQDMEGMLTTVVRIQARAKRKIQEINKDRLAEQSGVSEEGLERLMDSLREEAVSHSRQCANSDPEG